HDRERAAALFATASFVSFPTGDLARVEAAARRAGSNVAGRLLLGVLSSCRGDVAQARALLVGPAEQLLAEDAIGVIEQLSLFSLIWLECWDLAEGLVDRTVESVRTASAPILLLMPLAIAGELAYRRGRMDAAYAAVTESVQLAAETGQTIHGGV